MNKQEVLKYLKEDLQSNKEILQDYQGLCRFTQGYLKAAICRGYTITFLEAIKIVQEVYYNKKINEMQDLTRKSYNKLLVLAKLTGNNKLVNKIKITLN